MTHLLVMTMCKVPNLVKIRAGNSTTFAAVAATHC